MPHSAQPYPYLFEQRPPPKYGSMMQPPQPDGHLVAMPQDVVVQEARSPRIGSASRTAFCGLVSCLRGTTEFSGDGYLDVGGRGFGGQGDWACDRDGCEQHCGDSGDSGELHGDCR